MDLYIVYLQTVGLKQICHTPLPGADRVCWLIEYWNIDLYIYIPDIHLRIFATNSINPQSSIYHKQIDSIIHVQKASASHVAKPIFIAYIYPQQHHTHRTKYKRRDTQLRTPCVPQCIYIGFASGSLLCLWC